MHTDKKIRQIVKRIISENSNLPMGAENLPNAPWNEIDPIIRKGEKSRGSEYSTVWYGDGSGIAILKDSKNNLYTFYTDSVDNEDYEVYADREEEYLGRDEDGLADVELSDWSLDGDIIQSYINDNISTLSKGVGMDSYEDGTDLVLVDQELKEYLLDFAKKYQSDGYESLVGILGDYNNGLSENLNSDNSELYNRMEMAMDSETGKISFDDLNDIAAEYGIDMVSEEFMSTLSRVQEDFERSLDSSLDSDIEYVKNEFFGGDFPKSFGEFYQVFKNEEFDYTYDLGDVKAKFEELTIDPNQLSLFESGGNLMESNLSAIEDKLVGQIKPTDYVPSENEKFVKVFFKSDLTSIQSEMQELMAKIIIFNGETPKLENGKFSTFVPLYHVGEFLEATKKFEPQDTDEIKTRNGFMGLGDKQVSPGQNIKFWDYSVSETNPPLKIGKIHPNGEKFKTDKHNVFMLWDGKANGEWIPKKQIDSRYFLHSNVVDPVAGEKYAKITFEEEPFIEMDDSEKKELINLIKSYKGTYKYVFGTDRASGGQRYSLIPIDKADDFIQDTIQYGAQYGTTEQNLKLEDSQINEVRKIVRGILKKII